MAQLRQDYQKFVEREAEIIKSDWAKGDFKSIWIRYFYHLAQLAYASADHVYTLFEHNA